MSQSSFSQSGSKQTSSTQPLAMSSAMLPEELQSDLSQLDRRLRWVSFVKGSGSLLFVALLLAALFLVVDFLFPVSGLIRFGFLALLTATVAWLFYSWLFVPMSRKRRWADLAFLIDRSFPELQERVSSTVELSMLPAEQQQISSEFMVNRLRKETDKRLSRIDLWECLSLNGMAKSLAAGVAIALLISVPLLLNAGGYSLLWQRLLTPWANLDSATNLTFDVEKGDRTVPRGDDVFILAKPRWRYREGEIPRQITLTWDDDHGQSESRKMSYDERKGAYVGKIPQVLSPLTYVLHGSGSRSRQYSIHVADRPRLVDVRLLVSPPAYTEMETSVHEGAIGTIRAVQGSRLIAEISFEHPVREIEWRWSTMRDTSEELGIISDVDSKNNSEHSTEEISEAARFPKTYLRGVLSDDGLSARIEATAEISDSFVFRAISFDELENINEPERMIQVIRDRPPHINISGNKNPMKVRLDDVIPIDVNSDDDFGVQQMQIVVEHLSSGVKNPELLKWSSEKTGSVTREVYDHFDLDLTQFDLRHGDILGYRAVARDGRPIPEPNETWTSRRVVVISKDVAPLAGQIVEEYYNRIRRQADAVRSEMTQLRRDVERERRTLDPKPRPAVKEIVRKKREEWLQKELSLSLKLEELTRSLQQRPITNELSKQNAEPAQKILDDASQKLDEFRETNQSNPIGLVRDHEKSLRDAENLLNRLRNQLDDAERIEQELVQIQLLARRAKELSKTANQLDQSQQKNRLETEKNSLQGSESKPNENAKNDPNPQEKNSPPLTESIQELQKEHASLSQGLENLLTRRPELMQAAKNALLSELAAVAKQAEELAKQQSSLTEAAKQERDEALNDQKDLNAAIKQAEKTAEDLAAKSEEKSENDAAPVFDASGAKKAAQEQERGNLDEVKKAIQSAKEALKRFEESQKESAELPQDTQLATKQLAEKTEQLAKKIAEQYQRHQELEKKKQVQDQQEKQRQKELAPQGDKNSTEEEANSAAKKELKKQLQENKDEQQKLAEKLAGLVPAIAGLNVPPGLNRQQQEAMKKVEQAADQLAKQTDQADDRLRESAKMLKSLAKQLGSQEKRAQKAEPQLSALKKEANELTKQIQETAKKKNQADPAAAKNLANKQERLAQRLMQTDSVDNEKQLAKTMQAAKKTHDQLKAGEMEQAAASAKEFAKEVEKLEKAVQQAGKPSNKKQPSDQQVNQSQENKAAQKQAWEEANLSDEMKKRRFPEQPGTPQELKKELEKIAKAQKELKEKTEAAVSKNSNPSQAGQQKKALQQLSSPQKKIADQAERLQGNSAMLPRMKALQAIHEAAKSLKEGDAKKSQQHQKEAEAQIELAQRQLEKELENSQSKKTQNDQKKPASSASQLAKSLDEKLKQLDQKLAEQSAKLAKPAERKSPQEKELADAIEQLQQTQQRIADQTRQLSEQSKLEQPDKHKLNQSMQQAAESAKKTSGKMQSGQIKQAASQANQTAKQLEEASEKASADERSEQATKQLAEQQKQLAKQLEELAKTPQASRIAREKQQEELNREVKRLTKELNQIAKNSQADPINDTQTGKKTEQLSEQSSQADKQMQQALNQSKKANLQQAAQQSERAEKQLGNLAKESAQVAQMKRNTLVPELVGQEATEASRILEQAKQLLDQAMQQAQQQAENQKPSDSPESSGQAKSPSSQQSGSEKSSPSSETQQVNSEQQSSKPGQESGQKKGAESGQNSSEQSPSAMQQLAQQLSEAAKSLEQAHQNLQPSQKQSSSQSQQAQKKNGQGKPSEQSSDSETGNQTALNGNGKMTGDILRSALMRNWGEKQGALDAKLTDGRRRPIDKEYAPLIQRYFKALAQPEPTRKK